MTEIEMKMRKDPIKKYAQCNLSADFVCYVSSAELFIQKYLSSEACIVHSRSSIWLLSNVSVE